jgi:hypothetical protein
MEAAEEEAADARGGVGAVEVEEAGAPTPGHIARTSRYLM